MRTAVVTDSTSDLPVDGLQPDGLTVVPIQLFFGDEQFEDGVTLSKADFWRRMTEMSADEPLPTTSQPSPGAFRDVYQALLEAGAEEIVSVHLSGKLSGTLNSARQGAELLAAKPPLAFVDSQTASAALAWTAQAALAAAQDGANAAAAAQAAAETANRTRTLLFVETLDYLLRGGRIGRARHLAGRLLRVRPLLEVVDGEVVDIEKPRTRAKALQRLYTHIMAQGTPEQVAILHGQAQADADAIAQQVSAACGGMDVPTVLSSPAVGTHTGAGTVGAAVLLPS